jgi:hypothetical protein
VDIKPVDGKTCYSGNQIEKNEKGEACSTYGENRSA